MLSETNRKGKTAYTLMDMRDLKTTELQQGHKRWALEEEHGGEKEMTLDEYKVSVIHTCIFEMYSIIF